VVDLDKEASCFSSCGGNSSEQLLVQGQNKPDDITLSLMDQFEVCYFLVICFVMGMLH
jgi:hypothetical protein